jgi:hypothetical protein
VKKGKDANPISKRKIVSNAFDENKTLETHVQNRELSQDGSKLFVEHILAELDFAHVKVPDTADFEIFVNDL